MLVGKARFTWSVAVLLAAGTAFPFPAALPVLLMYLLPSLEFKWLTVCVTLQDRWLVVYITL